MSRDPREPGGWDLGYLILSGSPRSAGRRYRVLADVAGGCGLRQGEAFGLSSEDVDHDGGWLYVRRQVKLVRSRLVFGLPENDRERRVPLPSSVDEAIRTHLVSVPAVAMTLPWEGPDGPATTVALLVTSGRGGALNRSTFNDKNWRPAVEDAGLVPSRETGMHALRHFYASALLDAGESIQVLSSYPGHTDPGLTLRTYTHLMPSSDGSSAPPPAHGCRSGL